MKAKDDRVSVVESAKEVASSLPRITEEDVDRVFSGNIKEKIHETPSFRELYLGEDRIGDKNFNSGSKNQFEIGVLAKKSKGELASPTDHNIFWQNDVSFARNIYRWLVRQGFNVESWTANYFDPSTKVIRTIKTSPSVWLSASSAKHNLLVEVVHIHGRRGFFVKTQTGDGRMSTVDTKICDTIMSVKNHIKSKYEKDDSDDLLEAVL